MLNPYKDVVVPTPLSSKHVLINLLGELEQIQSFDDVYISSGRIISVKSEGHLHWVGEDTVAHMNVCLLVNDVAKGANVSNDVIGGNQQDCRLQITYKEKFLYRYRVNITSRRSGESAGIRMSLRSIKDKIPSLDYVQISQEMFEKLVPKQGLVLFVGETGSGKTTTLAALISHIVETNYGSGFISTYEHPVEYDLENIVTKLLGKGVPCSYEVHQHEIGVDLHTFEDGVKNALRSNPDIILLGELRGRDTIDSALSLALSGHLVFATLHASGVVETLSKLVSAFEPSTRDLIRKDFSQAIKGIVCQKLIPRLGGGRVLCRESLFFEESFKRLLQRAEGSDIPAMIESKLNKDGVTFEYSANELFENNEVSEQELKRILGE